MLKFTVDGQKLELIGDPHVVADSFDYLTGSFKFYSGYDWDLTEKHVFFQLGEATPYEVTLVDDQFIKTDHVNLTNGVWNIYVIGYDIDGATLVERITTNKVTLTAQISGVPEGEPFPPSIIPDVLIVKDQTTPQTFVNGVPKLAADREISDDHHLADKKYVDDHTPPTPVHNDLGSLQGGSSTERYHMTQAENTALHAHSNKTALDDVAGVNTGDQAASSFNHNDLANKQGGTTNEFYHVTAAEKTVIEHTSGTNTGDQVLPTRDSLGLDTDDTVTFANLSGTNTGDQDVSGAISTHNTDAGAHANLGIVDAGGYYDATTVEGALQEAGADIVANAVGVQASVRTSINLCNELQFVTGKYVWTNGSEYAGAAYMHTGNIPVTALRKIKINIYSAGVASGANSVFVVFFNASNTVVSGIQVPAGQQDFVVPATSTYIVVSWYIANGTQLMVVYASQNKGNAGYSTIKQIAVENYYIPYNDYYRTTNPLRGKYLVDFGDSIMRGDGTSGLGLGYLIARANNMAFTQYSTGGMTVADLDTVYQYTYDRAYVTGKRYFTKSGETYTEITEGVDWTAGTAIATAIYQINNLSKYLDTAIGASITPDYVLLSGLANDISQGVDLGAIEAGYTDAYDTATFSGALENAISRIRTAWIGTKIVFVRVHNMNSRDAALQVSFGDRAIAICKKWSVPYVDLYNECQLNTNISAMRTAYTDSADGTHPNAAGYALWYKPLTEAKLLSV